MSFASRLVAWLMVGLAVAAAPRPLRAQPEPEPGEEAEVEAAPRLSVIGRFSVTRLARWLGSEDPDERLRGIERLGEVGTAAAPLALPAVITPTGSINAAADNNPRALRMT